MRTVWLHVAPVAAWAILASPSTADGQEDAGATATDPRTVFEGTFVPVSHAANIAAIEAGIDRTVAPFVFIVRGIARSRLRDGNPAFDRITFSFRPGTIEMVAHSGTIPFNSGIYVVRSGADGAEGTTHGLDDGTDRVSQRFLSGHRLLQLTWTDAGARRSEYVVSSDGRRLTLHITITSPRLSVPVRYELHYRRR